MNCNYCLVSIQDRGQGLHHAFDIVEDRIGTFGVCVGGGGTASPRHTPPTPHFGFSPDFGHFILRQAMLTFFL